MAMMGALSSAVTGIKSQQTALDVIANNISNVNTTAYKSQTVSFSDLLSQTISSATAATTTRGGTNPQQIGLGTQVAATSTDLTVGSTTTTSNALDVALNGAGYLVVQGSTSGDYLFSRSGNMSVDEDGNLNINGYKVCGWEAYTLDADGNKVYTTTGSVEPINLYQDSYSGNKLVMPAKTTTSADVTGNLDATASVVSGATLTNIGSTSNLDWDATTTIDVVDEQGNKTEVTLKLKKCATENSTTSWYWEASADDTTISPSSGYIAFDSSGNMITSYTPLTVASTSDTSGATGYTASSMTLTSGLADGTYSVTVDSATSGYTVTLTDSSGNTYTTSSTDGSATFKTSSGTVTLTAPSTIGTGTTEFTVAQGTAVTLDNTPSISVKSTTAATNATTVELDFSKLTSTGTTSSLTVDEDGYVAGTFNGTYSIGTDGTMYASYSNGKTQSVGQIALAIFENAAGLEKSGSNLYRATTNSGDLKFVVAGQGGSGTMTSYALEASNVDLAAQFSSMMISQRAYQANTKVITTADDMLQSLINMV